MRRMVVVLALLATAGCKSQDEIRTESMWCLSKGREGSADFDRCLERAGVYRAYYSCDSCQAQVRAQQDLGDIGDRIAALRRR